MIRKQKIEKKCIDIHDLFPKLPLTLAAPKPKPKGYPKQILSVGGEFKAKRLDKSTLIRFVNGRAVKDKTLNIIIDYLSKFK